MTDKSINEEAGLGPNWKPIDVPAITGRPSPPSVGDITPVIPQYFQGSLNPDLQHDADFVNTALRSSSAPKFALMPPGIQSSPLTSTQLTSAIKTNAPPTPTSTGGSGITSLTLTAPAEINVAGSPTSGTTPEIDLTWNPEPGLTVFSGPASAAPGFDGAFSATKITSGASSFTTTGGTPPITSGEYAIYIAAGGSLSGGLIFTGGTPSGWTVLAQSTSIAPQYAISVGSSPVSALESWTASGAAQVSGMIVYLKGTLPAFANSITATPGTTSVSATLTGMTPGNSVLALCQCALRFPATTGIMTDSQGNTPILLGSIGLPFGAGVFGPQMFAYIIPNVSASSDTVTFSVSPASTSNSLRMSLYEIPTPSAIAAIPRFQLPAPPNVSVVTGVLSPHNGGTGSDLATTGGASQVLQQTTVGGAITVAQLAASDLSNGTTGSSTVVLSSAPTITNPAISGKVTSYNGRATVGGGVPSEIVTVDLINQSAAITATNLTTAAPNGMARISWVATVTQADAASSTLGPFQILYTNSSTSVVKTSPGTVVAGVDTSATNSTSTGTVSGCIIINAVINSTIQYQMGYTSGITPMQYNLHIKLEAL